VPGRASVLSAKPLTRRTAPLTATGAYSSSGLLTSACPPGTARTETRMNRPPPHVHGKEGVDGSSPSEGFTKGQQMALLSPWRRTHTDRSSLNLTPRPFTGAGRAFSAGADLPEVFGAELPTHEMREVMRTYYRCFRKIRSLPTLRARARRGRPQFGQARLRRLAFYCCATAGFSVS
jgi:hypothetical protein